MPTKKNAVKKTRKTRRSLQERLGSKDPLVRISAIKTMNIRNMPLGTPQQLSKDKVADVRKAWVKKLDDSRFSSEGEFYRKQEFLLEMLKDKNPDVLALTITALRTNRTPAVLKEIKKYLNHKNKKVREAAKFVCAEVKKFLTYVEGGKRELFFKENLASPDPILRIEAIHKLRKTTAGIKMVLKLRNDRDIRVRRAVVSNVDPYYLPLMLSDPSSQIRSFVLRSMRYYVEHNPSKYLIDTMKFMMKDSSKSVRKEAEYLLKKVQNAYRYKRRKVYCFACGTKYRATSISEEWELDEYGDSIVVERCPKGHKLSSTRASLAS